jgi:hypothetical protein
MLHAGVCINYAEKTAALILESGPGDIAVEPCSGACREAIELYFTTRRSAGRGGCNYGLRSRRATGHIAS